MYFIQKAIKEISTKIYKRLASSTSIRTLVFIQFYIQKNNTKYNEIKVIYIYINNFLLFFNAHQNTPEDKGSTLIARVTVVTDLVVCFVVAAAAAGEQY